MTGRALVLVIIATAGGCTGSAEKSGFDSPIGVSRIAVAESNSTLAIIGYGVEGDVIARVDLRTGRFYADTFEAEVDGRQLRIDVDGRVATHESAGRQPLKLPLFTEAGGAELNELLLDPRVRRVLARWQIHINDARPSSLRVPIASGDSSTPYGSCSFTPTPDCRGNGTYSCAQTYKYYLNDIMQCVEGAEQNVCCASIANGGTQRVAMRICGMGPRPDMPIPSNNPCGMEGPGGCAVCWTVDWASACSATASGHVQIPCTDSLGTRYWSVSEFLQLSFH